MICSLSLSFAAERYPVTLNGPLAPLGDVFGPKLTDEHVVFLADQDIDGVIELYSVPLAGGPPVKLNGPLGSSNTGQFLSFQISVDQSRVVYRAADPASGAMELYSVAITGGPVVKLSGPLVVGSEVSRGFLITPDSTAVLYHANQDPQSQSELYRVPIAGGAVVMMNPPLVADGTVKPEFRLTPDGSVLVFRAEVAQRSRFALFSMPAGGGAAVELSPNVFKDFQVSGDGARVLWINGVVQSVPIGGGEVITVSLPDSSKPHFQAIPDFKISPDGATVIYRHDRDVDDVFELYRAPTAGGTPAGRISSGGRNVGGYLFSPDSTRVVYAGRIRSGRPDYWSVSLVGDPAVNLSGTPSVFDARFFPGTITPDSQYLLYEDDRDLENVSAIYRVPLRGGATERVSGDPAVVGSVGFYRMAGSEVLYSTVRGLYRVNFAGGSSQLLSGILVEGGRIGNIEVSPNGRDVAYSADQEIEDVQELFHVPLAGGTPRKLSGDLRAAHEEIRIDFTAVPGTDQVVYRANEGQPRVQQLYLASIDGTQRRQLSEEPYWSDGVHSYYVSPDGTHVVYFASRTGFVLELFCVPLAGGSPVLLEGPVVKDRPGAPSIRFSPDSSRVLYLAVGDSEDVRALWSVPPTGGQAMMLNGPLVTGGNVHTFQVTPDSSEVLYLADQETDGVNELYAVPLAGGAFRRLTPRFANGSGVVDFLIGPTGARVLYVADEVPGGSAELYSMPLAGGPPVLLNDKITTSAPFFRHVAVSPDGLRVLYIEDMHPRELWSIPVTGGAAVKLNAPLPDDEDVFSTSIGVSPDSGRVFYWTSLGDVYSVPILGGPTVRLNEELDPGEFVGRYSLSPDGSHVVYPSDHDTGDQTELFSVAAAGGPIVKLNGVLPPGVSVDDEFLISDDSRRVIFRVDANGDGRRELHEARIDVPGSAVLIAPDVAALFSGQVALSPADHRIAFLARNGPEYSLLVDKAQALWTGSEGEWSDAANWRFEQRPNAWLETNIGSGKVRVSSVAQSAESLSLAGCGERARLELAAGSALLVSEDAVIGAGGVLAFEWNGLEQEPLTVGGHLDITAGTVEVQLANGFLPDEGATFRLWSAGSLGGVPDWLLLPALPAGRVWDVSALLGQGEVRVAGIASVPYATFAANNGLTNGPDEDEEGDRWLNVFEYLSGRDPRTDDAGTGPLEVRANGSEVRLAFAMSRLVGGDLLVEIESSSTLEDGDWVAIAQRAGTGPWTDSRRIFVTPLGGNLDEISFAADTPDQGACFYRIRLTLLP